MSKKTELTIRIRKSMREKGISSYKELLLKSNATANTHFCDILMGRQQIKEKDLLKISETLEIPLEFFTGKMEKEVRYRVIDTEPVFEECNEVKKKNNLKEYNRIYKRKWRERHKERIYEKEKEYARNYRRAKKEVENGNNSSSSN